MQQLKKEIAEPKQKPSLDHHYELRNAGLRTWRFDSATGDTCIQLTSEADWKRKETKEQSWQCADFTAHYNNLPPDTKEQRTAAQN